MTGTLRCSDFFLLPQIMGLGLVFFIVFHFTITRPLLVC